MEKMTRHFSIEVLLILEETVQQYDTTVTSSNYSVTEIKKLASI